MNRNRLLLIGVVALMLGAFASFVVYRSLQARTGANQAPGQDVVLAAEDIPVGSRIEDKDLKVVRLPSADLPPNSFKLKSKILGRGAVLPISKGEFILPYKLAGENAGFGMPTLIPRGMRAVSVRVNDIVAVAGFVIPGTHVDVLLTGNPSGSGDQQTTTVLENVAVIAVGQKLERNSAGEPQTAPVITLLVSPDDAEKLTLASTQGHIQLALRNPLDTGQETVAAVNSGSLYRNMSMPVSSAPVKGKTTPRRINARPAVSAAPSVYSIEVIRGDKKDVQTF
ncbi:MAG: Flp pilus assembly protein CpaB [Terriglobales bacterium]